MNAYITCLKRDIADSLEARKIAIGEARTIKARGTFKNCQYCAFAVNNPVMIPKMVAVRYFSGPTKKQVKKDIYLSIA